MYYRGDRLFKDAVGEYLDCLERHLDSERDVRKELAVQVEELRAELKKERLRAAGLEQRVAKLESLAEQFLGEQQDKFA